MRLLKNANIPGWVSILSSSSCECSYQISRSPRGQSWGESKQQKRRETLKGWQVPSYQTGGLNTLPTVAESALLPEESPAKSWIAPSKERRNGIWLALDSCPGGGDGQLWGKIHHLPVLAFPLEGLICFFFFLTPKQRFFNIFVGCTLALYSWLHCPLSHPGYLHFFLDSLDVNWFCQHAQLQWWKPQRGQAGGMHGLLLPSSFFLSIIQV